MQHSANDRSVGAVVEAEHVVRRFDNTEVLSQVCLEIREAEFFTLLGLSGCGKTTLMRLIAGAGSSRPRNHPRFSTGTYSAGKVFSACPSWVRRC